LSALSAGYLIALEGIDGSGKSTQAPLLTNRLCEMGIDAIQLRVPDYDDDLGRVLLAALQDPNFDRYALQALFAAARLGKRAMLNQMLRQHLVVVLDRYYWSSLAYGVATGLAFDWCAGLESPMPHPAITFLLDIEPNLSQQRSGATDALERNAEMLSACREVYLRLAREHPRWCVIDAAQPVEAVSSTLINRVEGLLKDKG
jgi:dTMP kinase